MGSVMSVAIAAGAILVVSSVFVVLGLGGGILFVPILHWSGFDFQTVAIPLGLLLNGTNTLLALVPYGRAGLVDWKGGWPMALAAAATAPIGALVQPCLDAGTVLVLFAAAVSLAAYRVIRAARDGNRKAAKEKVSPSTRIAFRAGIGAAVGFVGGLLGIGAGFMVAPAFMALGYAPKQTAATTALVVTVCSFAGFAGYAPRFDLPLGLTALGIGFVVIGSQVGARLMLKGAKPAWITWGYVVILSAVAAKLVWEALTSVLS